MNNSTLEHTVSQKDDAPETLYPMAEIEKAWQETQLALAQAAQLKTSTDAEIWRELESL